MEEYTQITLDEWTQWKEDIRIKLAETANNFVYIGYRLKQIRDSGMFGGAADVFEFAQNEYGLGKSTVSRFIAINEKYSEGGNSLELKEEFRSFSSSKLSEMLTLPDNEIQLITEKTTIRAIRELKKFDAEDPEAVQEEEKAAGMAEGPERTPLEKCLIDFFELRKEMLNGVMKCLETDPPEYKQAAELMAPSGQAFHKKGIVFLFLYEWSEGVKYKLMTELEPVYMNWPGFLNIIYNIYGACDTANVWEDFYGKEEQENETDEKPAHAQSNQGSEPVATSQQKEEIATEESHEEKTETAIPEPDEQEKVEGGSVEDTEKPVEVVSADRTGGNVGSEEGDAGSIRGMDGDGRTEAETDATDGQGSQKAREDGTGEPTESEPGCLKGGEELEKRETAQRQQAVGDAGAPGKVSRLELVKHIGKAWERLFDDVHEMFMRDCMDKDLTRRTYNSAIDMAAAIEQLMNFVDLATLEEEEGEDGE